MRHLSVCLHDVRADWRFKWQLHYKVNTVACLLYTLYTLATIFKQTTCTHLLKKMSCLIKIYMTLYNGCFTALDKAFIVDHSDETVMKYKRKSIRIPVNTRLN